jgi:hypothetical protein
MYERFHKQILQKAKELNLSGQTSIEKGPRGRTVEGLRAGLELNWIQFKQITSDRTSYRPGTVHKTS